ncbi:predicted protein [Nematostella vectensis]|uniref:FAD synthase n=1 Tax=Nematostella vectensis TaxID=45351 RepID=A7RYI4_NEMVE|nr:predicted protein [Nematostella vectensis]|eukprot:XP_001635528.1 predicted protein [Nematostella vectensis]
MADNVKANVAKSCGIIIIGDEILKGHTQDSNSSFLAKKLWCLGIKVPKISVISDHEFEIIKEIEEFSKKYDFVITTGGIGPTHDDVTISSIAKAFGESLVPNEELAEVIAKIYRVERSSLNSAHLKMCHLPPSAKLHYDKDRLKHPFPILSIKNVFVLPGIPEFIQKDFPIIENLLLHPDSSKFYLCTIFLSSDEAEVAHILDNVVQRFKESVSIGSYPECTNAGWHVKLNVESESQAKLHDACQYLLTQMPPTCVQKVEGLNNHEGILGACLKGAWAVIQESLKLFRLDELCISFNGGKDCTVLLYIMYAAVAQSMAEVPKINALYVRHDSPFKEAENFVEETTRLYNLNLICMSGKIKPALEELKKSHPNIKAILMGTRRHDPFTEKLHTFSWTDQGWPEYLRINPILDWNHQDVWSILLHCKVPYCTLYDNGYTSLGSSHNTRPNPVLRVNSNEYKPAYLLEDDQLERAGRT